MNLAHLLLRSARLAPDAPAIALGKQAVVSYGQLADRASRLAAGLTEKLKLEPGDRIGIAAKNCPEYHELLFACWHAGLVAVPKIGRASCRERVYVLV